MSSDNNIKYFSIFFILMTCFFPTEQRLTRKFEENHVEYKAPDVESHEHEENKGEPLSKTKSNTNCWTSFSASQHFTVMDELDQKYAEARKSFHKKKAKLLNAKMLKAVLSNKGVAYRTIHNFAGDASRIPAGLHLGGHSMIVFNDSVLFFSRLKLRNNTVFRVNYLENDLMNMTVEAHLCLHDLHLLGAYERAAKDDLSVLYYVPNAGEMEVLLKNVNYKIEGRLRLQGNRLVIETVVSDIRVEDILLSFVNNSEKPVGLQPNVQIDFLKRIKHDLDLWIMDYFNDYYTYFELNEVDSQFRQYEKSRILAYNRYADYLIKRIKQRIYDLELTHAETPKFTVLALPGVQIRLSNGIIRGLDTLFKKSLATGIRQKEVRHLDMVIGFSSLKMLYKLDVNLPIKGFVATSGNLQLTADDLTATLQVSMVKDPDETVDLKFNFLQQMKPFALTVEGPANRLISNYHHVLERHAINLMLNALIANVKNLGTLTRCNPYFHPDHGQKHLGNDARRRFFLDLRRLQANNETMVDNGIDNSSSNGNDNSSVPSIPV